MQGRHFEAIARAVSQYGTAHGKRQFMPDVLAEMIVDEIRQFNARLDRDRFIAACQPKGK